jgi:hypothetical protein
MSPNSEGPFGENDIRNLSAVVDIYHRLGGAEKAISNLEARTKSNGDRIEEFLQWVPAIRPLEKAVEKTNEKIEQLNERVLPIPNLEKHVAQNTKDLNEVGRRHDRDIKALEHVAYGAKLLGNISLWVIGSVVVISIAFATFLYHHLVFK